MIYGTIYLLDKIREKWLKTPKYNPNFVCKYVCGVWIIKVVCTQIRFKNKDAIFAANKNQIMMYSSEDLERILISESDKSLFSNRITQKMYLIVNKQIKFLTAFPLSQMNSKKLAPFLLWRGNVFN